MRKILSVLLVLLTFSTISKAQISKGSVLLGGQISYSRYKTTGQLYQDQNASNAIFNISAGKAIKENTILGINLSYSPYTTDNYYGITYAPLNFSSFTYTVGIFYRKYQKLGSEFYFFMEAGIAYIGSKEKGNDKNSGNEILIGTGSGGQLTGMPGIAYKVSKKFLVELTIPNIINIQYSSNSTTVGGVTSKNEQTTITTSLNSTPLNAVGIGFRVLF